jgi:hypothetical protein
MLGFILLLGALSCRFLIRGEPPVGVGEACRRHSLSLRRYKNAANPSGNPTLAIASPTGDARIRNPTYAFIWIDSKLSDNQSLEKSVDQSTQVDEMLT